MALCRNLREFMVKPGRKEDEYIKWTVAWWGYKLAIGGDYDVWVVRMEDSFPDNSYIFPSFSHRSGGFSASKRLIYSAHAPLQGGNQVVWAKSAVGEMADGIEFRVFVNA